MSIGRLRQADGFTHWVHALQVRETLQYDSGFTINNAAIVIVGTGGMHEAAGTAVNFRILEGSLIEPYFHKMQPKEVSPPPVPAVSASLSVPGVLPPTAGDGDF